MRGRVRKRAAGVRLGQGVPQPLDRQRILRPHVHVPLLGPHRKGRDRHPLDQPVRIPLQHAAVHEGTGVALVGVAHHEAPAGGLQGHGVPLEAGGVARATATPQAAGADLGAHLLGGEALAATAQLGVGAVGEGIVDRLGVEPAAALQHHRPLQGKEGMLPLQAPRLQGIRIGIGIGIGIGIWGRAPRRFGSRHPVGARQ